jgi:hypothetical protein
MQTGTFDFPLAAAPKDKAFASVLRSMIADLSGRASISHTILAKLLFCQERATIGI